MTNFMPALDAMLEGEFQKTLQDGIIQYSNPKLAMLVQPNTDESVGLNGNNRSTYQGSSLRFSLRNLDPENIQNGSLKHELNQILAEYGTNIRFISRFHPEGNGAYVIPKIVLSYQRGTPAFNIVASIAELIHVFDRIQR